MTPIETSVLDTLYTIAFTNKTLGRTAEEGLNVWVCENVTAFRQSLDVLKEKTHLRVISAGPSIVDKFGGPFFHAPTNTRLLVVANNNAQLENNDGMVLVTHR